MNQEGFGRPVFGNAEEEEEYVSIGDSVTVFDVAHPDEIDFRLTVASDGTVLLREVGRIYIAGLHADRSPESPHPEVRPSPGLARDRGGDLGLAASLLGPR